MSTHTDTAVDPGPQTLRTSVEGSIATILLDVPGRTMNVIDALLLSELRAQLDRLLIDDSVSGIVLASGKPGAFGGGADLKQIPLMSTDPSTPDFLRSTHELVQLMADSPKPIVAAIAGFALGGALEVALGAGWIIATPESTIGLPEATLGLIPGGGGTQLVLRRVDAGQAVTAMVSGQTLGAAQALEAGFIDRVVSAEELLPVARELALTPAPVRQFPSNSLDEADQLISAAVAAVRRPPSRSAAVAIAECVRVGLTQGMTAGLAAEREHFMAALASDEAAALIHLFHAETAAKRQFRGQASPANIAVVGSGQMGAGVAASAVGHGVGAVVRDVDPVRIEQARERAVAAAPARADELWQGTTDWDGFAQADVVVEAVFEDPKLKWDTLTDIAARVPAETLITTNTSAIPVVGLSGAVTGPERFLGTHFFSPVEKMALVELVPHTGTGDEALARAGGFARALGKVPVVVADKPGFFTSRVYARWIIEGFRLLLDGASPEAIEQEAKAVGFPVGPLQSSDEVTVDLVLAASVVQVAEKVFTERIDVPAVRAVMERLIENGHRGKRFGKGIYAYVDGRRSGFAEGLSEVVGAPAAALAPGEAGARLLDAFVTESLGCWDDGTLCHPDDGDVASVLGIGFPRALGGPFFWVDRQGADQVLQRLEERGSTAFAIPQSLRRLAQGGKYADEARRGRPGA